MPAKKTKQDSGMFLKGLIDKFVEFVKKLLSVGLFDFLKKWIVLIGHYALYIAAALSFLIGIIAAIRIESFRIFAISLGVAVAFIFIQYISEKFHDANDKLIENNETQLASNAFLESIGLVSAIIGIVILLYNLYVAIKTVELMPLLTGIGGFAIFEFLALFSFNPKLISTKVAKTASAGEEAIGILSFFLKIILKIVPIIFGVGLAVYTIYMLIHSFGLFGESFKRISAWRNVSSDMGIIVGIGLLPLFAYIWFVINFLIIDIIRAILAVPEKLDKITK